MTAQEKANEIAEMLWSGDDMNGDIIRGVAVTAAMQMHEWTRNELLKDATDIKINRDFLADIKQYIHEKYLDYKVGEKVKLVLIKEEEL